MVGKTWLFSTEFQLGLSPPTPKGLRLHYYASVGLVLSKTSGQTSGVRLQTNGSAFSAISRYENKSKRYREITTVRANGITKDMMPLS